MKEWRKSVKFHLKNENWKDLFFVIFRNLLIPPPWHWVRVEMLTGVEISKDLHPQHGEDVDEDYENEGKVGLAAQGGDDDGEQDPHSPPCLS